MTEELITLYKYTSSSSALSILSTGTFAYRHPKFFNDPFDSHINDVLRFDESVCRDKFYAEAKTLIENEAAELPKWASNEILEIFKTCRNIVSQKSTSIALDFFKERMYKGLENLIAKGKTGFADPEWTSIQNRMRVLCLSKMSDSITMWSHYAESHKGAVIEVKVPMERLDTVRYRRNYPEDLQPAVYFAKLALGLIQSNPRKLLIEQITSKSHWWKTELEQRIILAVDETAPDLYCRPAGEISAVFFGCKMSEIDKEGLLNVARALHGNAKI